MHILYLSQYFPPETGATQIRAYEMASHFINQGHSVTVITEIPNHPSGIIPDDYHWKLYEKIDEEGIEIIRVWVKASPVKNSLTRIVFYLSYMFSAVIAGIFLARKKYDLIYASSPPLFVGGAGLLLGFIKSLPLVFEVRDLWPESAVSLGELSSKRIINWATQLEEACYRNAQKIIVVTKGIESRLIDRGIPPEKISLITNGANTDHFQFKPNKRSQIRKTLDLENKFVISYPGILGIAYDFKIIFKAAKILGNDPSIHFLIIGEGPQKVNILNTIHNESISNISLLPEQTYDAIPGYLSASDAIIIPLKYNQFLKDTLPVKMFDAWSCQRPVILCNVEGEASQIISEAEAGLVVNTDNVEEIVSAIQKLQVSPKTCENMGHSGREYVIKNFARQVLAEKLLSLLLFQFNG